MALCLSNRQCRGLCQGNRALVACRVFVSSRVFTMPGIFLWLSASWLVPVPQDNGMRDLGVLSPAGLCSRFYRRSILGSIHAPSLWTSLSPISPHQLAESVESAKHHGMRCAYVRNHERLETRVSFGHLGDIACSSSQSSTNQKVDMVTKSQYGFVATLIIPINVLVGNYSPFLHSCCDFPWSTTVRTISPGNTNVQ